MVTLNLSIDVSDLEAGIRFYSRAFGFEERSRPLPTMAVLDAHNVTVCIHEKPAGSRPAPDAAATRDYARHWTPVHIDFHVDDYEATLQRAQAEGASVEQTFARPRATAFCSDPFGNGFCIIGPRAASEPARTS